MTTNRLQWKASVGLALAMALALMALPAAAPAGSPPGEIATAYYGSSSITWDVATNYTQAIVTVSGDGHRLSRRFTAGDAITFPLLDERGLALPDGAYGYELRLLSGEQSTDGLDGDLGTNRRRELVASGRFEIAGGSVRSLRESEDGGVGSPSAPEAPHHVASATTMTGRLCLGNTDCASGYTPTDSIEIVDSGIPEITFRNDMDNPSRYWEIEATNSSIHFTDVLSGNFNVLTIEEGSPSNSLHIDSEFSLGKVGLGTALPATGLHLAGDTDITLEEPGVATWRVGTQSDVGDVQFELVDDGAGGSVLDILVLENNFATTPSGTGVGIYAGNPDASLHVGSPGLGLGGGDGSAQIMIEETNGTTANRRLLEMRNNGPVTVRYVNTAGLNWNLNALNGGFVTSVAGSGQNEMLLEPDGDLVIAGNLSQGSSREIKQGFSPVDSAEILSLVAGLPLSHWSYRADAQAARHIGPMAEDFHTQFGVGADEQHLSPSDVGGVALAAIQALNDLVAAKEARIVELEQKYDALAAKLEAVTASSP